MKIFSPHFVCTTFPEPRSTNSSPLYHMATTIPKSLGRTIANLHISYLVDLPISHPNSSLMKLTHSIASPIKFQITCIDGFEASSSFQKSKSTINSPLILQISPHLTQRSLDHGVLEKMLRCQPHRISSPPSTLSYSYQPLLSQHGGMTR